MGNIKSTTSIDARKKKTSAKRRGKGENSRKGEKKIVDYVFS